MRPSWVATVAGHGAGLAHGGLGPARGGQVVGTRQTVRGDGRLERHHGAALVEGAPDLGLR